VTGEPDGITLHLLTRFDAINELRRLQHGAEHELHARRLRVAAEEAGALLKKSAVSRRLVSRERPSESAPAEGSDERLRARRLGRGEIGRNDFGELGRIASHQGGKLLGCTLVVAPQHRRHLPLGDTGVELRGGVGSKCGREAAGLIEAQKIARRIFPLHVGEPREPGRPSDTVGERATTTGAHAATGAGASAGTGACTGAGGARHISASRFRAGARN